MTYSIIPGSWRCALDWRLANNGGTFIARKYACWAIPVTLGAIHHANFMGLKTARNFCCTLPIYFHRRDKMFVMIFTGVATQIRLQKDK